MTYETFLRQKSAVQTAQQFLNIVRGGASRNGNPALLPLLTTEHWTVRLISEPNQSKLIKHLGRIQDLLASREVLSLELHRRSLQRSGNWPYIRQWFNNDSERHRQ
jgi:hypothetical protein